MHLARDGTVWIGHEPEYENKNFSADCLFVSFLEDTRTKEENRDLERELRIINEQYDTSYRYNSMRLLGYIAEVT